MYLGKFTNTALLLIRLVFGGLMIINHGYPKLKKLIAGGEIQFADPLGIGAFTSLSLAIFSELLCAAFLLTGLWSRWVSIPLIVTMLIAIFIIHWDDPFASKEKAIIFLTGFLAILLAGPGRYSIDNQISN